MVTADALFLISSGQTTGHRFEGGAGLAIGERILMGQSKRRLAVNDGSKRQTEAANKTLHAQSEMRFATAMMVDMVGSTSMSERLGPEASFLLLDKLLGIARSIVATHGGIMMEELGDGFFALFGAPLSIERASLAASKAGLEVCAAVHAAANAFETQFGLAPQLRVGLAAGEVLLTGSLNDGSLRATGNAVNLAARLQTLAESNGVVCSKSVALETQGWVRLETFGPHNLKGFLQPVEAFHVREIIKDAATPSAGGARHSDGFVGREPEIAQLNQWIEEKTNKRPLSLIIGAAGIGKSRITAEFAAGHDQRQLIVGSCHPTTTARPLAPLIEILRGYSKWSSEHATDGLVAPLERILQREEVDRALLVKLIDGQAFLGTDTDASEAIALRSTLVAALSSLAQDQNCLLLIEDLHWIDPLSAEVLMDAVGRASRDFRMLGTTRPVGWLDELPKDSIESVQVGPLQASEIGAIAQAVMGAGADETLINKLAQNSEGNPFFAIEILHNVTARGEDVEAGRIGTIQNIALARFDRLDVAVKALLRMASVQGRTFRLDVLQMDTQTSGRDVDHLLEAAKGLVEPDPGSPENSYRFNHILLRDSIYATIPPRALSGQHFAVAQALETCMGTDTRRVADQLADHYDLAGDPTLTVKYLCIAASNAYGFYALESCKSLMKRAFILMDANVDTFSTEELEEAVSIQIRCLDVMDQFRAVIEVSDAWLPRLRVLEASPTLALLLALTGKAHCHMSNYAASHQRITEALEMASRIGFEGGIAYAKVALMRTLSDSGMGRLEHVEQLFEETRAFTEGQSDGTLYANRMFHMMSAYRTEGMRRRTNQVNDEIQRFAARHKHHHVQLVADWNRTLSALHTNDNQTALKLATEGLESSTHNAAVWEVFMLMKLSSQLNLGIDVPLEPITQIEENCDLRGEFTTRNSATIMLAYAKCAKGNMWQGWRQLRDFDTRIFDTLQIEFKRFSLLHRAEFLLIVAGLIKVDGPPPKLGPKDILAAIYLRLTARRTAKALLHQLLSQFDHEEGLFVARARAALAVIAAAEGKNDAAKEDFIVAERLFREESLVSELDRLAGMRAQAQV